MQRRILFVDDEEKILQGLKRLLYGMRDQWEMLFTTSAEEALEMLSREPADVVVSDCRMPGMDGRDFLSEVKRRFSDTVRIVLSGQSEKEAFFKASDVAHQYLVKPCDPEKLKAVVVRACTLRDGLKDPRIKQAISRIGSLPSLPSLYADLMAELKKEDPSIEKLGNIISSDIAMSTKVLQLINSPFFGLFRKIANPRDAVVYLGIASVKALALGHGVFSQFDKTKLKRCRLDGLWSHSLAVASVARRIASYEKQSKEVVDDSFMAGLLHDLGKLILAEVFTQDYEGLLAKGPGQEKRSWEMEAEAFGADHAQIGGYVMGLWGMPDNVVEAIFFSHSPGAKPTIGFSPLTAVHAANAIVEELSNSGIGTGGTVLDEDYIATCGLAGRYGKWREAAEECLLEEKK